MYSFPLVFDYIIFMKSLIKQDSYWFVEGEGDESKMAALCGICAKKHSKGWFWSGQLGYGDYDLFCVSCKNAIHLREKNEIETSDKDERQQASLGSVDT